MLQSLPEVEELLLSLAPPVGDHLIAPEELSVRRRS